MCWQRLVACKKHRGAILISALLWSALAFAAITVVAGAADSISEEKNWQTATLRGENTVAQTSALAERWLKTKILSGDMFTAKDFEPAAKAVSEPVITVPDEVFASLRAVTPYASIDAEVIDLNYAESYKSTAEASRTPRAAPLAASVNDEAGDITDYRVKFIQLKTRVVLPSQGQAVFSRTETFLVLLARDGSLKTIRLYSKKS